MHFYKYFVFLFFSILPANSYKILVLFPFTAKSHWLMFEYLIEELLRREHEVTAITSFKPDRGLLLNGHENYTEILIDPPFNPDSMVSFKQFYERKSHSHVTSLLNIYDIGYATSKHGLQDKKVQHLIKSDENHFDIIIAEQFMQESWLMFAYKYRAPVVTLNTFGYSDAYDRIYGYYTPWSVVSHHLLPYNDEMSFIERAHNALICSIDWALRNFYHYPKQQALIDEYFVPHMKLMKNESFPDIYKLERKVALILVNSHVALDHPRPSMPNLINVGGIHLRPTNPLPEDLKKFIDEASHGVIYFSFGSNIRGQDMPEKLQETFIEVFRNLPQRVLWKFEGVVPENIPENILIWKWFPQHDILAHPNVRLFITHGGLFSMQESLFNGIPMLIIPFFNDQFKNAARATREGYGKKQFLHEITHESLNQTISDLLNDEKYRIRAQEVAEIFNDNLKEPMETAIYWIEYVAKHKKAREFLISKAIKLHLWEFYMLDVIFAVTIIGLLFAWIIKNLVKICCSCLKNHNLQKNKVE
ncbi:UDP-glycosyltransferase UGT4-like [Culicoides brevitarsis]|uniref:UDP-glycosyltransferase UGT4-like n=1 Tax=Culicoides brevitarsis TaxID=469753 RepID=UPI00307B64B9